MGQISKTIISTALNGTIQESYGPANNARADVIAAARCFIKLKKTGKLDDLFED